MPCNSDYLEPRKEEINSLNVLSFLIELGQDVGNFDGNYGRAATLKEDVVKLCNACQKVDIKNYSLELQIWWRDHQKADEQRIKTEIKNIKKEKDMKLALKKLTPYEKKLLKLNKKK